jgi:hypothetical protein
MPNFNEKRNRYLTTKEATEYLLGVFGNPHQLAVENHIDDAHVYRAKNGDYTKRWLKLLRELGLRPNRTRFTADIPQELKDDIQAERDKLGMSNNGELLEAMWLFWKNFQR